MKTFKVYPKVRRSLILVSLIILSAVYSMAQTNEVIKGIVSHSKNQMRSQVIQRSDSNRMVEVGYGQQASNAITGAIAFLGYENFNQGNIGNPIALISGRIAGLSVSRPGGDPNGNFDYRIRGLRTLYGNPLPLIVVDGIPGEFLENLDPSDIKSVSVLKDASSSSIFGIRGSSGVILISTRNENASGSRIEYDASVTTERVARNLPVMNAEEWKDLSGKIGFGTDFGNYTNWFKEIEQNAVSQIHSLAISGANDKTSYQASLNYRQGEGVMIRTGYRQFNSRIHLVQKALHDRLLFRFILGGTNRESDFGFADAFHYASIYNPTAPVKNDNSLYQKYQGYFQQIIFDDYNPVAILELDKNQGKTHLFHLSGNGSFAITKALSVDATYAIRSFASQTEVYFSKYDPYMGLARNGLASQSIYNFMNHYVAITGHYNGHLSDFLPFTALVGFTRQDSKVNGFSASGGDFLTDAYTFNNLAAASDFNKGLGLVESGLYKDQLIAYFGRLNMDLNKTLYLMASARYEACSCPGTDQKWVFFPAAGAGIELAQLFHLQSVSTFRLRADYGIAGNRAAYDALTLLRVQSQSYSTIGSSLPGYPTETNPNPDVKGEKSKEFNAGIDFSSHDSRFSGSLEYYYATTLDLVNKISVPVPPNLFNYTLMNIGKLKNSGWEFTLQYDLIRKSGCTWQFALNGSYIASNYLTALSKVIQGQTLALGTTNLELSGVPTLSNFPIVRLQEDKPVGQLLAYNYEGIDKNGFIRFADENHNGYIDPGDRRIVGNGLPKFLLGLSSALQFKRWDSQFLFRGVFGHKLLNLYRAAYEVPDMVGFYNLPVTAEDQKNAETGVFLNSSSGIPSSHHIENASFVALDNLSLGYHFNMRENSGIHSLRIYLAGNNLIYVSRYKGSDPNPRYGYTDANGVYNPLISGIDDLNTWPRVRSFTLGIQLAL